VSSASELPGHDFQPTPGSGPLGVAEQALARLNSLLYFFSMLALLGAALVLTSSVVTRYLFKVATDWQDEASVFLMVFATFACGAQVQSFRGHVGIGALASVLPARANRVRLFLCDVISLVFCGFFSWKSLGLLREAIADHQTTSSSWGPPLWIPYSAMTVGMAVLTLQLLLQVLAWFRRGSAA
jgi:TRAP-type C4-dicarboxylate transport system permease small subunit